MPSIHIPGTVCSLCGSEDVQVKMMMNQHGDVDNRALCDVHAAKLERWWKREHKKYDLEAP